MASGDVLPYLCVISASVSLPCTDRQIYALFLVTPSNQHLTAIFGTNILELIDPNEVVNHKRLYRACTLVKKHSILKWFHYLIKRPGFLLILSFFYRIITKVTPVCYRCTIMISPTDETRELSNLSFVDSCITILVNCDQIVVPYRVANVTDVSVTIQNKFHYLL